MKGRVRNHHKPVVAGVLLVANDPLVARARVRRGCFADPSHLKTRSLLEVQRRQDQGPAFRYDLAQGAGNVPADPDAAFEQLVSPVEGPERAVADDPGLLVPDLERERLGGLTLAGLSDQDSNDVPLVVVRVGDDG